MMTGRREPACSSPPFFWRTASGEAPPTNALPSHTTKPKNVLWRELLDRDFEAARLRLTLYPGDVFYNPEEYDRRPSRRRRNQNNNMLRHHQYQHPGGVTTCLHVACRNRSPWDIIQRLLDLYPGAIYRQDSEGWTPLHTHILHGSVGTVGNKSREDAFCRVFKTMLYLSSRHPCRYSQEYHGFEYARSLSSLSVATIHAHTTGSPLHLFCCHGHHHETNELALMQSLVEADPTQVVKPDPNQCFPGTLLWRLYRNRHRRYLDFQEEQQRQQTNNEGTTTTTNTIDDPAGVILQILFVFLSAVRGDFQNDRHSLSEVIAYQAKYAGPDRTDFVRLYLEAYPESVGSWNEEGKLPIHVAAASWPRHVTRPSALVVQALSPPRTLAAYAVDPLWRLLQDTTTAAAVSSPEVMAGIVDICEGRLPLHFALTAPLQQVGESDSAGTPTTTRNNKKWSPPTSLSEDGGLDALVNAYPAALSIPDPQTGLPAAALAAWVTSQLAVTDESAAVGLVYSIVRLCPCVLPHNS